MALDPSAFRAIFPEFSDTTAYPDARVQFALNEAALRLLPQVWGGLLDTGTAYFVAHRLALTSPVRAGVNGGPTQARLAPAPGLVTSSSVGSVSKGLDVSTSAVDGAGEWNATTYGREFAGLAATVAAGAMQY